MTNSNIQFSIPHNVAMDGSDAIATVQIPIFS